MRSISRSYGGTRVKHRLSSERVLTLFSRIASASNSDHAATIAVTELPGLLTASFAVLTLLDQRSQQPVASFHTPHQTSTIIYETVTALVAQLRKTKQSLIVSGLDQLPLAPHTDYATPQALIALPLMINLELAGMLCVASEQPRQWRKRDIQLLETIAVQLANIVERDRLTAALDRSADELSTFYNTTSAMLSELDLQATLQNIIEQATRLARADSGWLYLYNEASRELEVVTTFRCEHDCRGERVKLGEGLAGRVALSGEVARIDDYGTWTGRLNRFGTAPFHALLAVPVMHNGKLLGVLDLIHLTPGITFSDRDVSIVQLFSAQAAIAITNARLYHEAHEAARLKSEFVATVSHELRTPMGAIMGYAELLTTGSYGNIPDALHDPLNRLKTNAERLLTLINQMLDLSRIEAGRLQFHHEPLSLEDLFQATAAAVQQEAHSKGLRLQISVQNDVPNIVLADVARLRQILVNLVGNSIKFTQRGSVTLSCACDYGSAGRQLVFEVSDTGPGIAADQLALIWQPFRQVDGSTTRLHNGSGLGLAIVERLTTLMGGSVLVDSVVGVGSTFTIRIPVEIPS